MKLFSKQSTAVNRPQQHRGLYVLLSCLIPFTLLIVALIWLRVTPFGDKTLVISDGNALYINYLAHLGRMLKGHEGIIYSFKKGLGGNMMPNIGITMLNPFFAVFALFSVRDYPVAYTLVSVLNFSLCGLTMYLLLADIYGHKLSNLIFSTTYALMGFNVANVFQVFFFIGVHVLPLMILGLRRLLRGKSPLIYVLALGYAVLTSYYFGFMLCVFSVLFFLLYLWMNKEELNGKKKHIFIKFSLSSVCGGLMGAAIWLPSLLGISGGRLDQTKITDFTFQENMPLIEIGAKLFTGANDTDELINGLPNIYVGILPLALVLLFFLNKDINKRRKTAAVLALGFYLLSFYIVAFNMAMHGGTVTNWFNYRYSFVFSFLLLIISAYEWQYLDTIQQVNLKKTGYCLLGAVVLIFSKRYGFVTGGEVLLDLALLSLIYLAFYLHRKDKAKNSRKVFEILTLFICSFQLLLNYYISTGNLLKKESWSATVSAYQETVDAVAPLVDGVQKGNTDFFRMEVNLQRSGNCGNDPMLYGYNGVGHSGSYERFFVRSEVNKLGVNWYQTRNYYNEGIPAATDTLLGLRYILAQENLSEEKGYQNATNFNQVELFQDQDNYDIYYNSDALPIANLAEPGIEAVELDYEDIFYNLNQTWEAISGEETPVFVEEDDIHFCVNNIFDDLEITAADARKLTESYEAEAEAAKENPSSAKKASKKKAMDSKERPEYSSYIEYTWEAKRDGAIYTYDRASMLDGQGSYTPILKYLGYYHKGDTVTGYITAVSTYVNRVGFEEIAGHFRAAYADSDTLHELATIVKSRPCTIEKIKDSYLRGEFTAEAGQKLMFTIPYDEGWTCYVDGEQVPINMVLGVFMAMDVPEGTHSYEMKFFPTGMKTGIGLSAAALLTTMVYIPMDTKRRKQKLAVQEEVPVEESTCVI